MRIGKPWQFICPLLSVCHLVSVKDLGVKKLEAPCAQLGELVGAKDLDEAPSFRPPPADVVSLDSGYAGPVGCDQAGIFPISDQEVTLLGVFDPGSEPSKIMQDGRGSLSPEVVHQSADSFHERPLVSEAESSSGVGFLGISVAHCFSLADNAARIGCEDNPVLPSLDEDIALSPDSSPSFSMEPPWWYPTLSLGLLAMSWFFSQPYAVQRNLVPDDDSTCRIAFDVERLRKQLLELKDQRCLDLQLPCCTQAARESFPDVSPAENEASGQGMSLCDANAYPSCHLGPPT
ncbi:hypothetical protein Nepgr_024749 [Nepenthes gracilis]|uniref:Uncharacterized protein n=1 Tax=Nepenthes gracilis TaxID=150966 RepID=A0AAD3Y0U2_NEPGR|nr:hypothetical protein Nepgr_024749 [Nepenthes gracilis]